MGILTPDFPALNDAGMSRLSPVFEQYGNGVLQIASPEALSGVTGEAGGVFAVESEVALSTTPTDFAARAETTISAEQARDILQEMGYSSPARIANPEAINWLIQNVPNLTQDEITQFINAASQIAGQQ